MAAMRSTNVGSRRVLLAVMGIALHGTVMDGDAC
jgi:hypothetical protein